MKKLLYLLILLHAIVATAQESGSEQCAAGKQKAFAKYLKNARQQVAYPGDGNIDVTYYGLNFSLDPTTKVINGETAIYFKTLSSVHTISIDLRNALKADSIKIGNLRLTFNQTVSQLQITLDKHYEANQPVKMKVYYHGIPGSSGFGSFAFETHGTSKKPAIWSLSEPYGASDWFPCKDSPADKADSSDVVVSVPDNLVVASNGTLVGVFAASNNYKTYKWKNSYPIAQYLISVAISDYQQYDVGFKYDANKAPMVVSNYVYLEALTDANKKNIDQTVVMLDLFSKKFGLYPFIKEKYGHAQFNWGGGMEHQTCTSIVGYSGSLISHELAHQWFGDLITCKSWEHIWLNEGFATFCEWIYAEHLGGKTGYQNAVAARSAGAKAATGSIFVQNINSENEIFSSNRTYAKGGTVLHSLRGIVGDDVFFKILQTYTKSKHAYGNATTEDFQAIVEQVTGQSFDYFFKQWIYGTGFPTYQYSWLADAQNKVKVNISQTNTLGTTFFKMPIQLLFTTVKGDTLVTVLNDQNNQNFDITLKSKPSKMQFDPDNWILKNATELIITSREETQMEENLLTISPNPVQNEAKILFSVAQKSMVQLNLLDLNGRLIEQFTNQNMEKGSYEQLFSAQKYPKGIYLIQLQIADKQATKRILLN